MPSKVAPSSPVLTSTLTAFVFWRLSFVALNQPFTSSSSSLLRRAYLLRLHYNPSPLHNFVLLARSFFCSCYLYVYYWRTW